MRYQIRYLAVAVTLLSGCSGTLRDEPVTIESTEASLAVTNTSPAAATEPVVEIDWPHLEFDFENRSEFDASMLPQRIRELEGKRVRVRGYFHAGAVFSRDSITRFILLAEIEGPSPIAARLYPGQTALPLHHLMMVEMVEGETAAFTSKPIEVTGRLTVNPIEVGGATVCVFQLVADSVVVVNPRPGFCPALVHGC